jgi:hypothetical protein
VGKTIRCIGIIVLLAAVVGCDVFFVSRGGRYNPLDPDNEFVEVYPQIDGYAEDTFWDEANNLLIAQYNPPESAIVMRFNVNDIPDDFDSIYLRLYKSFPTVPETVIRIHPIIADWATITDYYTLSHGDFIDVDVFTRHYPRMDPGFELIDLDPIVAGSTDSIRYGIVIFSEFDRIEFQAMEILDPLWKPRLYISTK